MVCLKASTPQRGSAEIWNMDPILIQREEVDILQYDWE